ncbi:MAG: polyphosphate kinase 1 [bacterium]
MSEFRCELLSADQLASLASGPLPHDVPATEAIRSLHRDLYLDTSDDSLRQRGVVCRLRANASGGGVLALRIAPSRGGVATRIAVSTRTVDVQVALAENNEVVRRLSGIVDPSALHIRADLEIDRLTRGAAHDWLRRPRLEIHLDRVTIRKNGTAANFLQMCVHQHRGGDDEIRALERALEEDHGVRASRVGTRERAELAMKWARLEDVPRAPAFSDRMHRAAAIAGTANVPEFLNAELGLLAFQRRVLSLAADRRTPLRERLRFLAIISANIDEFFMVRMAGLAVVRPGEDDRMEDGFTPGEQLAAIGEMVAEISAEQSECAQECLAELRLRGVHVCGWLELSDEQRASLRNRFRDEMHPLLTPFAMTLSPGHPLPRLAHLSLSIATILRNRAGGPPRFAEVDLPPSLPRFFDAHGSDGRVLVPVEEIVRANLDLLYPESEIEQAFVFRVTRSAELELDEACADDLLDAVERATAQRGDGCAVRIEVERAMPPVLRALLLEDLRRERGASDEPIIADVEEAEGLLDLRGLALLPLPDNPETSYPRFEHGRPFAAATSVFDCIASSDVLAHHPFDSFSDSVVRFIRESADDPNVAAIKMTLYRVGKPSPVAEALLDAARGGKAVTVFVELKARFDEDVNVGWARALEGAGGHVVRGLVGLKNHAKVTLVVRREGDALRRYAHVGTGNYNARSGDQYTDLSLFTIDPEITGDIADLFNELTGTSEPPRRASRAILVAPHHLLPGILHLIDREAVHARAGRPARITAKFNGLSDPDVVRALSRAAEDGVEIDLVVRGICTLRPGVPGRSSRVRIMSVVGRFLEHSRIYRFENAGDPKIFIGSADLRPRNLRRRVELLVPVRNEQHRRTIDRILDFYVTDPSAWDLNASGEYVPRNAVGPSAQDRLSIRSSFKSRS